jgi:CheY-like chemotaxis protein
MKAVPAPHRFRSHGSTTLPLDGRVIVYVEDDPCLRRALVKQLSRAGATVRAAPSVADGLALHLEGVDVILSDGHLGDGSALELLAGLRHLPGAADVPVVVYTGDTSLSFERSLLRCGAVVVLWKPLPPQELSSVLAEVCAFEAHGQLARSAG